MRDTELRVYDQPMCCSTGVCGPEVDPALARFAADLEWLKRQGVAVHRYNPTHEAGAFVSDPVVRRALQERGSKCRKDVRGRGLAVELASRGVAVHLTTTDPAAQVADVVGETDGPARVTRIDPEAEVQAYRAKVLARAGKDLDDEGRALLEEDLRSPCTEEVAVFHAFSKVVSGARRELVIMDTAPTGHTLLLLDAAGSYHREIMRNAGDRPGAITTPLMRLRDPDYTRILLVTLAETTPVLEARALADDLVRAGIEPYGWVVNNSLAAAGTTDPLLRRRAAEEIEQIRRVASELTERTWVVPRLVEEPRGAAGLRAMIDASAATARSAA